MDRSKVVSGLTVYGLVVLLPTVHLLFQDQGWNYPFLERIAIGVVGVLAGRMVLESLRPNKPRDPTVKYWGITPVPLVGGLVLLYFAWFTNLPQALAGGLDGASIVATPTNLRVMSSLAPRIVTMLFTMAGVELVTRGVRTKKTPQERQIIKHEKAIRRRMRAQAAQSGQ